MGDEPQLKSGRARARAFTLLEIMLAGLAMTVLFAGLLRILILSRRATERGIVQNAALTWIHSYSEQIKAVDYNALPLSPDVEPTIEVPAPTVMTLGLTGEEPLQLSWGTPPAALGSAGIDPANGIANTRGMNGQGTMLSLKFWIWVREVPDPATGRPAAKGITLIYDYEFREARTISRQRASFRTLRISVPKY